MWSLLLMYDIQKETEYHERKEFLKIWKNYYSNELGPHFTNIRSLLIEEVNLKHMIRWQSNGVDVTEIDKIAMLKLFELATSDYKPVSCYTLQYLRVQSSDVPIKKNLELSLQVMKITFSWSNERNPIFVTSAEKLIFLTSAQNSIFDFCKTWFSPSSVLNMIFSI